MGWEDDFCKLAQIGMKHLLPGVYKKVTHCQTNLQLKAASLFQYVTFLWRPGSNKLSAKSQVNNSLDLWEIRFPLIIAKFF